jgi:hypothetical protein
MEKPLAMGFIPNNLYLELMVFSFIFGKRVKEFLLFNNIEGYV